MKDDLYQSKEGPSVEVLLQIIQSFTRETHILDSIEEMLSNLIRKSAPEKDGKHEFGHVWLTRGNARHLPSGTFYIFYSPSGWELCRGIFTAVQFAVATGNYITKSVKFDFPDNLTAMSAPIQKILLLMGFSEKPVPI